MFVELVATASCHAHVCQHRAGQESGVGGTTKVIRGLGDVWGVLLRVCFQSLVGICPLRVLCARIGPCSRHLLPAQPSFKASIGQRPSFYECLKITTGACWEIAVGGGRWAEVGRFENANGCKRMWLLPGAASAMARTVTTSGQSKGTEAHEAH